MARKKRLTTDLVEILNDRFFSSPAARAELEEARVNEEVARQIYLLREASGLTQRQLAERVGTSHSVISRLEQDDYEGHSLSMLRRIAQALGLRVEVHFVRAPDVKSA